MSKVMKVIVSSDFIREKLVKLMYEGDILHKDAQIIHTGEGPEDFFDNEYYPEGSIFITSDANSDFWHLREEIALADAQVELNEDKLTKKELKKLAAYEQDAKPARKKAWAKYKKLYKDDNYKHYRHLPQGHMDDPPWSYPMDKAEVAKYKDLDANRLYMKKKNSNEYIKVSLDRRHPYALDGWAGSDIEFWAYNPNHEDSKDEG